MAPSCSSRKKGKKKVSVESVDVVGIDRISNLPDSILCFILSFLPTLYSVRTSLLSKRWKLLWTQVPTIRINARHKDEISFTTPNDKGKLIEKIVSGILLHHNAPSLDILYLHVEGKISKLSLWINDAIAKNIKHLDLQTSFTESIEVPENLFICKTLESLKLYDLQVMIRGGVQLSRLHTLVLYFVTFGDEECFHKIVNGCPKLETLCFIKIFDDWDFMPTILVSSRTLKKFDMTFSGYYKPMVFEIRAPSLEYLSISNCFKRQLILNSLPSLLEVYIDLNDVYTANEVGEISYSNSITKLVQDVQHANSLSVTQNTIKYFGNATTPLPQLTRLSKLAIKVICCQWNNILFLLESSVNLEVLILQKVSQTL
ncbi:hypothetical protein M9H77_23955 [Catharanthus roseus]|uniref:Uncharacterized protein n=1 Tax=Catharanthus roseus TaxID=4058 RepID=A0ACC0AUD2_CATRO|nr:hypothetical protein M9H77_00216 [Catharanthus roseus]KAI5640627.1 hypothetical protein M9H77_00218 [Catharanthus roseus]KAI5664632.1 hypothetical protein M9H77_23955 [Catharanthus roseus]